jgi:hypothetical protein
MDGIKVVARTSIKGGFPDDKMHEAFYETRRFIAMFVRALYWIPC